MVYPVGDNSFARSTINNATAPVNKGSQKVISLNAKTAANAKDKFDAWEAKIPATRLASTPPSPPGVGTLVRTTTLSENTKKAVGKDN